MPKVTVEGYGEKLWDLEDIKNTVVFIANRYFFKHDEERVVLVRDSEGKGRFYRKTSPLIVPNGEGSGYILKSLAYKTEDGVYLDKKSKDVVCMNGKYYRKSFCTTVNGVTVLKTDPTIVKCPNTGKNFFKGTGKKVTKEIYGFDEVHPEHNIKTTHDGKLILAGDAYEVFDGQTGTLKLHYARTVQQQTYQVLYDFQDKTNPQEDRLVFKNAFRNDVAAGLQTGDWKEIVIPNNGDNKYFIHKSLIQYFTDAIEKHVLPRHMKKLEGIKAAVNKGFSDLDPSENVAEVFSVVPKPFPGKHNIYTPGNYPTIIRSSKFSDTGGFRYSYGIEFETAQGLIPKEELETLGLMAVGDRSIGAGEYVTPPLMGNQGLKQVKEYTKSLAKHTLVDDKCGLHIHIGGCFVPKEKGDKPSAKDVPSFSKQFLINCVNLGALLEEELYRSLPPSRKPTLYHCHSIRRFAPITEDNFAVRFGAYNFSDYKEWWLEPIDQCPAKLWDFEPFKLGDKYNANRKVGQWDGGRYKWLNLMLAYAKGSHKTIEFRIFSPTVTYEKTYAALMTAMAFTNVADNVPQLIKKGVTLSDIFDASFKKYPDIIKFLNEFYSERTKKFNRKEIYLDEKGKALALPFLK